METALFTDSKGNLLTARTWGRLQEEENESSSVIKIVANDMYNTPRDKSPSPVLSAAPKPKAAPSKASPALSSLAASRQRRSLAYADSRIISGKLQSNDGKPQAKKGTPGTSLPAKQLIDGRASVKGSPTKRGSVATTASRSIGGDAAAARPAWSDIPMNAPSKAVGRISRVESITGPPRRSTKDSNQDSSRPVTPSSRRTSVRKPAVPSLNFHGTFSDVALRNQMSNAAVDMPPNQKDLQANKGGPVNSLSSQISTPRTARSTSGGSTARLGSSRRSQAAPAAQQAVPSLDASSLVNSSLSGAAGPSKDLVLGAQHPNEAAEALAASYATSVGDSPRGAGLKGGTQSGAASTCISTKDAVPVAPPSSSRLKRVKSSCTDQQTPVTLNSPAGTDSPFNGNLHLKRTSTAKPEPSGLDALSHGPSSSRLLHKLSSIPTSPRLGRSVLSAPQTPRTEPVTYETNRLGSARGQSTPRLPKIAPSVPEAGTDLAAEDPNERPGNKQVSPMTPIAELDVARPSPRLGSHRSSAGQVVSSAAASNVTLSLASPRRPNIQGQERKRSTRDLPITQPVSDRKSSAPEVQPAPESPLKGLLFGSSEPAAESPRQRLLPYSTKRVLDSPRKSPLPSARENKDSLGRPASGSTNGRALAHTMSEVTHFGSHQTNEEPLARFASLPTSLRSTASVQSRKEFMKRPGPNTAPLHCTIMRDAITRKGQTTYALYLDDPAKMILAAHKRKRSKACSYTISLDNQDLTQQSAARCGGLRSNFLGTHFSIFDDAALLESNSKDSLQGIEIGLVKYQTNILGTRGPRKMTVIIPKLDKAGVTTSAAASEGGLTHRMKHARSSPDCLSLVNKAPKWNDQLVAEDDPDCIILQFGKIGKDKFSMDFRWPISTMQAFGICLSSFVSKLACE